MLAVQQYLQTKSLDDLSQELGIKVARHDSLPLVILNYDQIESPKTHPVVRECRGLVLEADTFALVARSFPRFFNWGEVADEMGSFDFSDFVVQSKEDGSLVLLYCYDRKWRCNTRGSFAQDQMQFQTFTWQDAIVKALGIADLQDLDDLLDPSICYVCEFCSPWNKIVRNYVDPVMYLLTAFHGEQELTPAEASKYDTVYELACNFTIPRKVWERPTVYQFKSIDEVQAFLQQQASDDPTFEGVVIRDKHGHRWKIKSATYLGLHKLKGEGDNMFNPKHLLPFVLAGEEDELLTYFPEVRPTFFELKARVLQEYAGLLEVWADNWRIQEQKEFALAVKDRTPFASVLFSVRKLHGNEQESKHVKSIWRQSEGAILKKLVK